MEISGHSVFYLGCLLVLLYAFYYCWKTSAVERETQQLLQRTVEGIKSQANQATHISTNTTSASNVTP
jgi:hypothetical protein